MLKPFVPTKNQAKHLGKFLELGNDKKIFVRSWLPPIQGTDELHCTTMDCRVFVCGRKQLDQWVKIGYGKECEPFPTKLYCPWYPPMTNGI